MNIQSLLGLPISELPMSEDRITASQLQANSALLKNYIDDAYQAGLGKVKIPPGTYRLDPSETYRKDDSRNSCLYFHDLKNFEIDATGVTIVSKNVKTRILSMENCDNVTITGGTFTRDPMGFSQGKIEAIAADLKSLDVRIPKGYPTNLDDADYFGTAPRIMALFDERTRDWVKGATDGWFIGLQRIEPDLFRFHLQSDIPQDNPIAVGNLVAWRGFDLHASVLFRGCQNMKIIGITVYNTGGLTVYEDMGEGRNYYYGCRIIRGPAPDGADKNETPLFSSAADGFHSASMRHGPTYENCYVEFSDDDGIAIHGYASLVVESHDDSVIIGRVGESYSQNGFRVGDILRLYDEKGALADDAKILEITPQPGYVCTQTPPAEFKVFNAKLREKNLFFDKIKLDHPVPAQFSWLAVNSCATGNGYVIRNCKIYHNRGRGMLIKASDGLIENCIIDGPTMGGIVSVPEIGFWNEADFVRNTIIRHNTIKNAGWWKSTVGGLNMSEWREAGPIPLPGGYRDVLVEENTFENNDGVNIIISSAQRIHFRNNRFVGAMQHDQPTDWGTSPSESLYWITQSKDITIEGNQIVNPGPYMKRTLKTTETTQNIQEK